MGMPITHKINNYVPRKVQFFWYDVVCKYWPWLRKNDSGTAQKMKPALSVMHSKAHAWSCQICQCCKNFTVLKLVD